MHESKRFSEGQKIVLVDIDETICFYPGKRSYDLAEPSQDNIDKINRLYDEGWYVIYWTARGGSPESKEAGRCYYDFTLEQLNNWGCKYHELSTGTKGNYIKPAYDLVIDDKAKRIEELRGVRFCPGCNGPVNSQNTCRPCGMVYGRRGWRQLGEYDG
jgi:hypothetical protein